jgi:UDP-N-acetylglucosamine 2-epimerase (non-hydrolysing)
LALKIIKDKGFDFENEPLLKKIDFSKRVILITAHRRENLGAPLEEICEGVIDIVNAFEDVRIVFPVHPNPNVRLIVFNKLNGYDRIIVTESLIYPKMVWLMSRSYLTFTD